MNARPRSSRSRSIGERDREFGGGTLQRLVLDFRSDELVVRCLYRSKGDSNPGTKGRRREVEKLTREGLTRALEALEAGAECVGTSGFTTREDVLLAAASPAALQTARQVKGA
jgi:hypothetical protein